MNLVKKIIFPQPTGLKWVYSVAIKSSYTGKSSNKRVMITNFHQSKKIKLRNSQNFIQMVVIIHMQLKMERLKGLQ